MVLVFGWVVVVGAAVVDGAVLVLVGAVVVGSPLVVAAGAVVVVLSGAQPTTEVMSKMAATIGNVRVGFILCSPSTQKKGTSRRGALTNGGVQSALSFPNMGGIAVFDDTLRAFLGPPVDTPYPQG
jgi:hypothetical protein